MITVRRTWRTTLLGYITSGTAYFVVEVQGQYLQANGTAGATEHQFAMTVDGNVWEGTYTEQSWMLGKQINEIAIHSVYGPLSTHYILPEPVEIPETVQEPGARF